MQVHVNGTPQQIPDGTTVAALIDRMGLAKAACAAEVNKHVVPRRDHAVRTLSEGDRVELVTLVGGG